MVGRAGSLVLSSRWNALPLFRLVVVRHLSRCWRSVVWICGATVRLRVELLLQLLGLLSGKKLDSWRVALQIVHFVSLSGAGGDAVTATWDCWACLLLSDRTLIVIRLGSKRLAWCLWYRLSLSWLFGISLHGRWYELLWAKRSDCMAAWHLGRRFLLPSSVFDARHLVRCHHVLERRDQLVWALVSYRKCSFICLLLEERWVRLTLVSLGGGYWLWLVDSMVWRLCIDSLVVLQVLFLYLDLWSRLLNDVFMIRVETQGFVAFWTFQSAVPCFIRHQTLLGGSCRDGRLGAMLRRASHFNLGRSFTLLGTDGVLNTQSSHWCIRTCFRCLLLGCHDCAKCLPVYVSSDCVDLLLTWLLLDGVRDLGHLQIRHAISPDRLLLHSQILRLQHIGSCHVGLLLLLKDLGHRLAGLRDGHAVGGVDSLIDVLVIARRSRLYLSLFAWFRYHKLVRCLPKIASQGLPEFKLLSGWRTRLLHLLTIGRRIACRLGPTRRCSRMHSLCEINLDLLMNGWIDRLNPWRGCVTRLLSLVCSILDLIVSLHRTWE